MCLKNEMRYDLSTIIGCRNTYQNSSRKISDKTIQGWMIIILENRGRNKCDQHKSFDFYDIRLRELLEYIDNENIYRLRLLLVSRYY